MENLLQYIQTAEKLDNETLLLHYERLAWNKLLAQSMRRTTATRDKYIRYEIWRMLPEDIKSNYEQDLSLKGKEEVNGQAQEEDENKIEEGGRDVGEKQSEELVILTKTDSMAIGDSIADNEGNPVQEGSFIIKFADESLAQIEIKVSEGKIVELKPIEQKPSEVKQVKPQDSELIQTKAKLYNERAKLSNSLLSFEDSDNEGRKQVLDQIMELDAKIDEIAKTLSGEKAMAKDSRKLEFDWLKTDEEKAKMTDSDIRVYKTALTNRRGKASAAIKKNKDVAENERIIKIIEQERLTLG